MGGTTERSRLKVLVVVAAGGLKLPAAFGQLKCHIFGQIVPAAFAATFEDSLGVAALVWLLFEKIHHALHRACPLLLCVSSKQHPSRQDYGATPPPFWC